MFKDNKYTKIYNGIIDSAKYKSRKRLRRDNKDYVYYESHHIIPKSMGGIEEVLLTSKEHFICHLLLPKMLDGPNKYKMVNALIRMTFSSSNGQERYRSRSYSIIKAFIAEKNSYNFKNKKKSDATKNNMKGRSGTWKRTEEHKKKLSDMRKGKYTGSNNGFYGKKYKQESIIKRNETRRMNGIKPSFNALGTKWFTNGIEDIMRLPGLEPNGFYPGRSKFERKNNIGS